jgi:peptide/nickel transport system permease protein
MMAYALLKRLGDMMVAMFGISIMVFLIFFAMPGSDPSTRIAGRNASPEVLKAVRESFGMDQPLPVQYFSMMKKLFVTQDLTSFVNRGWKVIPAVLDAIPVTVSLVVGAAVIWIVGAFLIGLAAAATKGGWLDRSLMVFALIGISLPAFWLGAVVNLFTQSRLHDTIFSWVPPLGYKPLFTDPAQWFLSLLFPWITLAIGYIGIYGRVLRANLVEALQEDYVRTARAKGLSEFTILTRHALRTSLISVVSLFGLDFGQLVGGFAVLTEIVFALPGLGKLTFDALLNLDLPVIMAAVMFSAFFIVLANAVVDMLYILIDPRVRADG